MLGSYVYTDTLGKLMLQSNDAEELQGSIVAIHVRPERITKRTFHTRKLQYIKLTQT